MPAAMSALSWGQTEPRCHENTRYVCGRWRLSRSGGLLGGDGDVEPVGFELADVPALLGRGVALLEEAIAQVLVGGAVLEQVVGDDRDGVPDRHRRPLGT